MRNCPESRREVPAAFPLLALILGLVLATSPFAFLLIALLLIQRPRWALTVAAFALGAFIAQREAAREVAEVRAFEALDAEEFVVVEAPLTREWSAQSLRVDRFRAEGRVFERTLIFYARFDTPPIGMATTIRAEGFLRRNDRGDYTLAIKSPRLMSYHGEMPRWHPQRWNRALAHRIRRLPHAEVALVEALVLGRSERLDAQVRENFRRGGTYHLLVFSGMQIALAAAVIAWLLRWLHAPRASDWCLLAFALIAPPFIGWSASVSRASLAIGLYAFARILRRPTSLPNLFCLSALLRLILVPADLGDPSFHLTYAGAGALLFIAKGRWWLSPLAAEAAVTPLTLFHFHQYAIGGSVMTLLMSPLVFAMVALSAVICAIPSPLLLELLGMLHALCMRMNEVGALTSGFFSAPPAWAIFVAYVGALLVIGRAQCGAAALGGASAVHHDAGEGTGATPRLLSLLLFVPLAAAWRSSTVDIPQLVMLDVGQGDAIVARSGARTLLVDGGGRNDAARFGETVLLPMLLERGIRRIDIVLLSHAHPDHCGGLPAVVRELDVGAVWISPRRFRGRCAQELLEACSRRAVPIHLVRDGDTASLDGIHLTAITIDRHFRRAPENNASVVARLQIGARRVLLTGDIERDAESHLADRKVRADVLKVAHHGSRSSTTAPLLEAVDPRIALISCGRHNLYGHPHPAVLGALEERRVRTWRTDLHGAVELRFHDRQVCVRTAFDTPPARRVQ